MRLATRMTHAAKLLATMALLALCVGGEPATAGTVKRLGDSTAAVCVDHTGDMFNDCALLDLGQIQDRRSDPYQGPIGWVCVYVSEDNVPCKYVATRSPLR